MSFFKKLFGKDKEETPNNNVPETDGETYIKTEKGSYILNKDKLPEYTYSEVGEKEKKIIQACVNVLNNTASIFRFQKEPANHPENLDLYLELWSQDGFGDFAGVAAAQHEAFLAYGFGQYLVDAYNMEWIVKSDTHGNSRAIICLKHPVEMELYPLDSTLRAISNNELGIFTNIEGKLKRALAEHSK